LKKHFLIINVLQFVITLAIFNLAVTLLWAQKIKKIKTCTGKVLWLPPRFS
jgi:hypothetical protein